MTLRCACGEEWDLAECRVDREIVYPDFPDRTRKWTVYGVWKDDEVVHSCFVESRPVERRIPF